MRERRARALPAKSRPVESHGRKFALRLVKGLAERQELTLMALREVRPSCPVPWGCRPG